MYTAYITRNFRDVRTTTPKVLLLNIRNEDGQLRQKRSDTHIGTIEKKYNIDLNVRSDMHLGTYLEKKDIASLNDIVNNNKKK